MRAASVVTTLVLAVVAAACTARNGAFLCFSDEECVLAGAHGTCEQTGFCSFADPSCAGGNRYGDYAGDGLGGRCVPGPGDHDGGPDQPDATPLPECGTIGDNCCTSGVDCLGTLECVNGTCGCAAAGKPTAGAYAHHSCAIEDNGSAWCWGSNSQGQIGAGDQGNPHRRPVAVADLTSVSMVAPGGTHTCAIAAGEVWCWGDNDAGQLGSNGGDRTKPKKAGLTGATWIDTGGATTCAVVGGEVHCWGRNQYGQVGDGTTSDRNKPKLVPNLSGVVAVSAGVTTSCALRNDFTVWCWGDGLEGQLGNGLGAASLVPVQATLGDVAQIAAGDDQVCARTNGGLVYCWGDNEAGVIGDGTTFQRRLPTPVMGLTRVEEIDVADEFACALKSDGTVWCWGRNNVGQLGMGHTSPFETLPQQVVGLNDATAIATGADHACARRAVGAIVCWGSSNDGQLGDDSTTSHLEPTPVQLDCP